MDSTTDFAEISTEIEFTTTTDLNNFTNIPQDDSECSHYGEPLAMFLMGGVGVTLSSLVGVIGNILCIIILTRPRMRSSTSIILLGLSVSDLCFVTFTFAIYGLTGLVQFFCVWRVYRNIVFPVVLPFLYPLISAAQVASTYFTVFVTVERFIVVYRPLQARTICTVKNAARISALIAVFAILFTLPTWWGFSYKDHFDENGTWNGYTVKLTALGENQDHTFYYINNWVWLFLVRLIPFGLLTVLNFAIYRKVRQANKMRKNLSQSESIEISIAQMLVWIVSIFLVCNVLRVYWSILLAFRVEQISIELVTLSGLFLNLNSAVNFIIYCLIGGRFRDTCAQLFCGQFKRSKC